MKKAVLTIAVFTALLFNVGWCPPLYAAEGEGTPAKDKAPDAEKKPEGKKDAEEGEGKSKKPNDVTGGRFAGDPVYVRLAPMTLPILGATGPEQLVTIQITVQVKDFDIADDMHTKMPKIMDSLLQALYGGISEGSLRNGRLVDIFKLKNKAMSAIQNVEGADNIKDILIVNMAQRLL